jgi:hypothetical protein
MDFTAEQYATARENLSDPIFGREAPHVVLGSLLQLLGSQTIAASLCEVRETSEKPTEDDEEKKLTTWRAAWVTETHFLYADASKFLGSWKASDTAEGEMIPRKVEAWAKPLSDVARLQIAHVDVHKKKGKDEYRWDFRYRATFRDQTNVDVPLFAEMPEHQPEQDAVEAFWANLRDACATNLKHN